MPATAHAPVPKPDTGWPARPDATASAPVSGAVEQDAPTLTPEERLAALRTLGHELRSPLSAIIGFAEILAHDPRGPATLEVQREYAEIIRQSGLQMLELVNRTLQDMADELRRTAP
jgi:two-component system cell cycle sensor histidine kinase PleC